MTRKEVISDSRLFGVKLLLVLLAPIAFYALVISILMHKSIEADGLLLSLCGVLAIVSAGVCSVNIGKRRGVAAGLVAFLMVAALYVVVTYLGVAVAVIVNGGIGT